MIFCEGDEDDPSVSLLQRARLMEIRRRRRRLKEVKPRQEEEDPSGESERRESEPLMFPCMTRSTYADLCPDLRKCARRHGKGGNPQ